MQGDYPDWLDLHLKRVFGDMRGMEAEFLSRRAPVYLRINTLKTDRERALKALQPIGAEEVLGLNAARIPPPDPAVRTGAVEVSADGARLAELVRLVDEGVLTLRVAETYALDDAAKAHARLDEGGVRGRLVLVP